MDRFKLTIKFDTDDREILEQLNSLNKTAMFIKDYEKDLSEDNREMQNVKVNIERVEE